MAEEIRAEFFSEEIEKARQDIIKKHKKCNGTGFLEKVVRGKHGFAGRKLIRCNCRKKFNSVRRFILSNIPYADLFNQQIYGKNVLNSVTGEKVEIRTEIIKPYVRNLKIAIKSPYGFLFLGKNGTGKTFIGLKLLYYSLVSSYTAHNIEITDLFKLYHENFRNGEMTGLINEISTVDMLMIDEVGNESKKSDFVLSELKTLIKRRVVASRPTILISNFSYDEFKKAYGKSVDNIIRSHFKVFDFSTAPDVRSTKCANEMENFFKKIRKK